jgi:hypothetical protein
LLLLLSRANCSACNPGASENAFQPGFTEKRRIIAPEPFTLELSRAEEIITLKDYEEGSASEGVEIELSFTAGNWMICKEMETSPEELDRGVGDCSLGMGRSDVFSEAFLSPIWTNVSIGFF